MIAIAVFFISLISSIAFAEAPHPLYYSCTVKCLFSDPDFESKSSATGINEHWAGKNAEFKCRDSSGSPAGYPDCERKTTGYVDLTVCNKTSQPVMFVAVAAYDGFNDTPDNGDLGLMVYHWRRVNSGECTDALDKTRLNVRRELYVYATTDPRVPNGGVHWTGNYSYPRSFCINKDGNLDRAVPYALGYDPDYRLVMPRNCDFRYESQQEMKRLSGVVEGQNIWNITD